MASIDLNAIKVATPCKADWNAMQGDDRVRFCGQCNLHVYDLSALSGDEARALIEEREGGRVCVRFFRRQDGTVLTRDCPVGTRAVRRRRAGIAAGLAAAAGFAGGLLRGRPLPRVEALTPPSPGATELPVVAIAAQPQATPPPEPEPVEFLGDMVAPPPPPPVEPRPEQGGVEMGKVRCPDRD